MISERDAKIKERMGSLEGILFGKITDAKNLCRDKQGAEFEIARAAAQSFIADLGSEKQFEAIARLTDYRSAETSYLLTSVSKREGESFIEQLAMAINVEATSYAGDTVKAFWDLPFVQAARAIGHKRE